MPRAHAAPGRIVRQDRAASSAGLTRRCALAFRLWHRLRHTRIALNDPLLIRLRHFSGCGQAQERAIYLTARLEAVRGAAGIHDGYVRAGHEFYRLLELFPYGRYRREADWDLAQIELRELRMPASARQHLRDFLVRYPADPRAGLARRELHGDIPRRSFLPSVRVVARRRPLIIHPRPATPAASNPAAATQDAPASARQSADTGVRQAARQALERQRWALAAGNPPPAAAPLGAPAVFESLHFWTGRGISRIVLFLSRQVRVTQGYVPQTRRLYFDLSPCNTAWNTGIRQYPARDPRLTGIEAADNRANVVRVVLDETGAAGDARISYFPNPARLVITLYDRPLPAPILASVSPPRRPTPKAQPRQIAHRAPAIAQASRAPANLRRLRPRLSHLRPREAAMHGMRMPPHREARPLPGGRRSLTRALDLGVRRVVIDPGHGGHDTGTIGPNGLLEKNLVLNVALRLGWLLRHRLGVQVVYTRDRDVFIPLQERTAIANRAHADLFVSIHANASTDSTASGIEAYYLNFTRDPRALKVAARENAGSAYDIHNLGGLITKIAADDKQAESRDLARDVENSLTRAMHERYRGVKSAPFIVLIGARMPSILAEISFLSNPACARRLALPAYRERIAYALFIGIRQYLRSLGQAPPRSRAVLARTQLPRSRLAPAPAHHAEH